MATVKQPEEVTSIMNNFNGNAKELARIAADFCEIASSEGTPIKKLLMAIELAIERSGKGQIMYEEFMESYGNISQ